MEGLEVQEINYSILNENQYFRIDSEFFLKRYLEIENRISKANHLNLDDVIEYITDGKQGGVTLTDSGVLFLRNINIKPGIIDLTDERYISENESSETKRAELEPGDILLTTIGTLIGDAVTIPIGFPKATINQNLVKIRLKDKTKSPFIAAFFNSKYGKGQIYRIAVGNIWYLVNYPNLKTVKIPIFSERLYDCFRLIFEKQTEHLNKSKQKYTQAMQILLFEIGLLGSPEAGYTELNLGDWVSEDPTEQMLANQIPGVKEEHELLNEEYELIMAEQMRLETIFDYEGQHNHLKKNKARLITLIHLIEEKRIQLKYIQNNKNLAFLSIATSHNTNIKSFSESFGVTGRLDAEYYQKKYENIIEIIKKQKYKTLTNLVHITKSIEPGSNHYSDEAGLPFYRVSDFNKFGLSKPDKELTKSFIADNQVLINKIKPKKDTILFSKDGSVGTAYLLREDLAGITSGAILHLQIKNSKEIIPEYLTLALNSKLVQMQAERDAGGSIILHWRKEEIEQVVVPIIRLLEQKQIAELIQESFQLKAESERLLEVAKKAVEIAIEEGETLAMKYIENAK